MFAVKSFRVAVPGSAYPKTVSTEDDLDPSSVEAKAALDLGLLSDDDAAAVRAAIDQVDATLDGGADATSGAEPDVPKSVATKAKGAAPENKAG